MSNQQNNPSAELLALVDALVEAIDAVDRVHESLRPLGGSLLFVSEMRLNARSSIDVWTLIDGEVAF